MAKEGRFYVAAACLAVACFVGRENGLAQGAPSLCRMELGPHEKSDPWISSLCMFCDHWQVKLASLTSATLLYSGAVVGELPVTKEDDGLRNIKLRYQSSDLLLTKVCEASGTTNQGAGKAQVALRDKSGATFKYDVLEIEWQDKEFKGNRVCDVSKVVRSIAMCPSS